jgi:hypothetical protein
MYTMFRGDLVKRYRSSVGSVVQLYSAPYTERVLTIESLKNKKSNDVYDVLFTVEDGWYTQLFLSMLPSAVCDSLLMSDMCVRQRVGQIVCSTLKPLCVFHRVFVSRVGLTKSFSTYEIWIVLSATKYTSVGTLIVLETLEAHQQCCRVLQDADVLCIEYVY